MTKKRKIKPFRLPEKGQGLIPAMLNSPSEYITMKECENFSENDWDEMVHFLIAGIKPIKEITIYFMGYMITGPANEVLQEMERMNNLNINKSK